MADSWRVEYSEDNIPLLTSYKGAIGALKMLFNTSNNDGQCVVSDVAQTMSLVPLHELNRSATALVRDISEELSQRLFRIKVHLSKAVAELALICHYSQCVQRITVPGCETRDVNPGKI